MRDELKFYNSNFRKLVLNRSNFMAQSALLDEPVRSSSGRMTLEASIPGPVSPNGIGKLLESGLLKLK